MLSHEEEIAVESYLFEPWRGIPNHERLPLLIYRSVFVEGEGVGAREVLEIFAGNRWTNGWENGVFDFHHFHPNTHEVLGVVRGAASVLFGGETGVELRVRVGDIVLIPAGVGHKAQSAESGFSVVGAYPDGNSPDLCRDQGQLDGSEWAQIREVPIFGYDPLLGHDGPMHQYWSSLK